jgi:hypothetical protein
LDGLTRGRVVHYVCAEDEEWPEGMGFAPAYVPRWRKGEHCTALIVGVPDVGFGEPFTANLQVFYDAPTVGYRAHVPYSETAEPGTWHFIERA